ncbi:BON domain-containing protein [Simiduia litorea]|uniref:BON domain-containing protein n=1 Tax=Simiduia litorea TaxID=1435348 RepID=UPI0036F3DAA0
MKKIYQKALSTSLLIAAISLSSSAFALDKQSQDIVDAKQESQIWTTYALSPYLRSNHLDVKVKGGKAILTGNVAEDIDRDLAKQIALGVKGVKSVENNIKVVPDYKPTKKPTEDRSYGQYIDDASITAAIKSKLLWSKNSDGMTTGVVTELGKVTLTGSADNGTAKELAGRLAKNTHGVSSVDNQLTLKKTENTMMKADPKTADPTLSKSMSDSWITTKVKSTFIYSNNVDSSDIAVSTKEGMVTLAGKVGSGAERELAIELAQNIRGVKSVKTSELTF